ncbi:MAG: SIMPL domain-containing protein [Phormidesmis sp.]
MKFWQRPLMLAIVSLLPVSSSVVLPAVFSKGANAQVADAQVADAQVVDAQMLSQLGSQPVSQLMSQPASQQPERVLSVTGLGTQMIPTTLSQVSLGVVVQASTAEAAQQQAAQRQTAVIDQLRSQAVENLETTGISLNPRYDYSDNQQRLIGYEATNTISFRVPTGQAGTVIDGAISAGATQINGVSFIAEPAALNAARQQALEAAIADAQQQADTVLKALGLTRQEIIRIAIGSVSAPPPVPVQAEARLAADSATTPVVGQSQTVDAQVTLEIRY